MRAPVVEQAWPLRRAHRDPLLGGGVQHRPVEHPPLGLQAHRQGRARGRHVPLGGDLAEVVLESEVVSVEGSDGLSMFVWSPADDASARSLAQLLERARS